MPRAVFSACLAALLWCSLCSAPPQSFCAEPAGPRTPSQPAAVEPDARNVVVKIGRHQGFVRFVFMSSEGNVQSASATLAGKDTIAVEFPPALAYHLAEKGPLRGGAAVEVAKDVRVSARRAGCLLTVENLSDFKISKLSSPPRLVIDALSGLQVAPAPADKAQAPAVQTEAAPRLLTFMIDAGHGGYDKGMQGDGFVEKDFALSFSKELAGGLARKGRKVIVTRKADQVLTIRERLRIASQRSPDFLLSLHVSSDGKLRAYTSPRTPTGGQENQQRAEAYARAHAMSQSLAESLAQLARGEADVEAEVDSLPLSLVAQARGPALLIELPNPEKFRYDGKGKEKLLAAIIKGLTAYPQQ